MVVVGLGFGLDAGRARLLRRPIAGDIGFVAVAAFFCGSLLAGCQAETAIGPGHLIRRMGSFCCTVTADACARCCAGIHSRRRQQQASSQTIPTSNLIPIWESEFRIHQESGNQRHEHRTPGIVESPTIALGTLLSGSDYRAAQRRAGEGARGILVLSRRRVVTRSDAFMAAVASSLGFAIFEGVGYTLGAGATWHQLILVRAPVVIMHLAATTIVVVGWYRWRETGRGFLPYFAAGTALHAGWNGLYVGFIYSLAGVEAGAIHRRDKPSESW